MLPEVVMHIIKALESKRTYAESQFGIAIGSDRSYYAGQAAAYTMALAMLKNGPQASEAMS